MEELNNTILIVFIVLIVSLGAFFGSVATSSSANDTNITNNSSNSTKPVPAPQAAQGLFPQVSLTITSSVNFGTLVADGLETSYTSATQIDATGSEWFPQGDDLNLYVRASGDLSSGTYSIPLSNLKYNGFSNSSLPKTSFTTNNAKIRGWNLGTGLIGSVSQTVYGNYYLTIPLGTSGGSYNTTIIYTAILE